VQGLYCVSVVRVLAAGIRTLCAARQTLIWPNVLENCQRKR